MLVPSFSRVFHPVSCKILALEHDFVAPVTILPASYCTFFNIFFLEIITVVPDYIGIFDNSLTQLMTLFVTIDYNYNVIHES